MDSTQFDDLQIGVLIQAHADLRHELKLTTNAGYGKSFIALHSALTFIHIPDASNHETWTCVEVWPTDIERLREIELVRAIRRCLRILSARIRLVLRHF